MTEDKLQLVGKNVLLQLRGGWIPCVAPLKDSVDDRDAPLPCPDVLLVTKKGERTHSGNPDAIPVSVPFVQGNVVLNTMQGVVLEMETDQGGAVHSWFPREVILSIGFVHRLGERHVLQQVTAPLIMAPP